MRWGTLFDRANIYDVTVPDVRAALDVHRADDETGNDDEAGADDDTRNDDEAGADETGDDDE